MPRILAIRFRNAVGAFEKLGCRIARESDHILNSGLHNKGVDQELRRKLTGHKSDSMNDRYTQTELNTLREAVGKLPELKA
jgi:hypothetical protein